MERDELRRMQKHFDTASVSSFLSVLNEHIHMFFQQKITAGIISPPPPNAQCVTPIHLNGLKPNVGESKGGYGLCL